MKSQTPIPHQFTARFNAYKNLGVSLEGRQKFVEAARAYIQAVQRQARDARALRHLEALVDLHPKIHQEIEGFDELLMGCREAVEIAEKMKQGIVARNVGSCQSVRRTQCRSSTQCIRSCLRMAVRKSPEIASGARSNFRGRSGWQATLPFSRRCAQVSPAVRKPSARSIEEYLGE